MTRPDHRADHDEDGGVVVGRSPAGAPPGAASPDAIRAERALHERTRLAFEAATTAGVAGHFLVLDQGPLLAVLATDPALAFLCTVSGVTPATVLAAIGLVGAPAWKAVVPTVVVASDEDDAAAAHLLEAGLVRGPDRALAFKRLDAAAAPAAPGDHDVVDAGDDEEFLRVLLAGYGVDGPVAAFIAADHRGPAVRRLLVVDDGAPIAAAAMTLHGDVAVLGGASTLPAHRGRGAQARLVEHRVRLAAGLGCGLAVASVRPGSVSAANLHRAGFQVHHRSTWTKP